MKPLNQCTCTIVDVRGAASAALILIMLSRLFMCLYCCSIYIRCKDMLTF